MEMSRSARLWVRVMAVLVAIIATMGSVTADTSAAEETFCGNPVVEQGAGSWQDQLNSEANLFYDGHIRSIAEKFGQGRWVCVPAHWVIDSAVESIAGGGAQRVLLVKIPQFNRLVKLSYELATQQPATLPDVGARYLEAPVPFNGVRMRTAPVTGEVVHHFNVGDSVWIMCQRRAADGTLWDRVATTPGGSAAGWVADRLVYTGTDDQVTASC